MSRDIVHVDLDLCVGHGKCYLVAPSLMEPVDDDGHAGFIGKPVGPEDRKASDLVDMLVMACPEGALSRRSAD